MVPWWAKLSAKLVLSRLPVSYGSWIKLKAFRHGQMNDPTYASRVLRHHLDEAFGAGTDAPAGLCLEIGPGDSLFTGLSAAAAGFDGSVFVDAGDWAERNFENLRKAAHVAGLDPARISRWESFDAALDDVNARYLTNGLDALRSLPDNSISFIFSQAVLEHIRKHEYSAFIAETQRVLIPGGRCSHRVDLQDHLSRGLNNLRFSEEIWESHFFSSSGFYTNRLSYAEHRQVFENAGYSIRNLKTDRFDKAPIEARKLAKPFRDRSLEERLVKGFDIVAEKPHDSNIKLGTG